MMTRWSLHTLKIKVKKRVNNYIINTVWYYVVVIFLFFSMAAYHELDQSGDRLINSVPVSAGTLLSGNTTSINEVQLDRHKQLHKSVF